MPDPPQETFKKCQILMKNELMKNEQLGPQDKNCAFLGVFHWGLLGRKGQTGLEFIAYYQNVCQKTNKQSPFFFFLFFFSFFFYKVSPARHVALWLLRWLQSLGF